MSLGDSPYLDTHIRASLSCNRTGAGGCLLENNALANKGVVGLVRNAGSSQKASGAVDSVGF